MTIPHIIGNPLEEIGAKQLDSGEVYVLGVKNPHSAAQALYCINKENLFAGAFQMLDVTDEVFNNPLYETSYQDLLPSTFNGLPVPSRIGIANYTLPWLVEFRRNPNMKETLNSVQYITLLPSTRFLRYGLNGVWSPWQLLHGTIGALQYMMTTADVKQQDYNYMGYLPLTGMTYTKQQYPDLYNLIKDKVTSTAETFTLPDATNHYVASNDTNAGKVQEWKLPDFSDTVNFAKGTTKDKTLFKEVTDAGKFIRVSNKATTTSSYLEDNIFKNLDTGDAQTGDNSGLTAELKLDLANKFGANHVGTKLEPNTFFASCLFVYAGYPQV